MKMTAPTRSCL